MAAPLDASRSVRRRLTRKTSAEAAAAQTLASVPRSCGSDGSQDGLLQWRPCGSFGACVEGLLRADLARADIRRALVDLWHSEGGLLAVRGLHGLTSQELVDFTAIFGKVECTAAASLGAFSVPGAVGGDVSRIGNTRDSATGKPTASLLATLEQSPPDDKGAAPGEPGFLEAVQYDVKTRTPVWHTDSVHRQEPPAGSALYCVAAPPRGGDTCFADTRAAFDALPAEGRARLESLEGVCSMAHHDVKAYGVSLTVEQRAANPPLMVPLALYGMNSSTCFVLPKGAAPPTVEELDKAESLEAWEHESVNKEVRTLLPHVTSPRFVVRWRWAPGDVVVWDNRCTMHTATGYDYKTYVREMWRTTFHDEAWVRPFRSLAYERA
eukprot:gnl/TRDRNA2_/TRDRNA2_83732_c0_seq1.p1 gnl/TRDRNA2_/TRDRNA2_83732_c0~~gnl/TRDRNA2_/TRDRNA2_83732_c0_seq1.p1  ORF type:complete len:400 (+),score=64.58 gnl/TRDRNA2_/TRDRNA2_83732_c0_seq1:58-1200(+)